ncbi:serine/arginine repetitive matrix protein 1 [Cyclospora cayetanensis]|uniref:Serine/arginine repetitive matrix protein 1 n=1 Tax=Cyclospora cayetanensis TaxID=88456 RepID=A0A6P6S2F4_9EIME|nr:serine/arginine repetitive matrix protein 1 [Cyclospora cayetanensis]
MQHHTGDRKSQTAIVLTDSEAEEPQEGLPTPRRSRRLQSGEAFRGNEELLGTVSLRRRRRRPVKLHDSEDDTEEGPTCWGGTPQADNSQSPRSCSPIRRRSARLEALSDSAVSTPQPSLKRGAAKAPSPGDGWSSPSPAKTARMHLSPPPSTTTRKFVDCVTPVGTPASCRPRKRLRHSSATSIGIPQVCPPEEDTSSLSRAKRCSRPLTVPGEGSEEEDTTKSERGGGRLPSRSTSCSTSPLRAADRRRLSTGSGLRKSHVPSSSSPTAIANTDAVSGINESSPQPAGHRRLRKQQHEPAPELQEQEKTQHTDQNPLEPPAGMRPSQKELRQRLHHLARKVREKSLKARGLHAPEVSETEEESNESSACERGGSKKGMSSCRRAPQSARKASRFFSYSRDLQEAASDSEESAGSFIADSPNGGPEPTSESGSGTPAEEALDSESSDSSGDEAVKALRYHHRLMEMRGKKTHVEQTMRLKECFQLYVYSLALNLFSPQLGLRQLQDRGGRCQGDDGKRLLLAVSSSPTARALKTLSEMEIGRLVAMETHAFPPECKSQLKSYAECRLSGSPELQGAVTRCIVCRRHAARHYCLDLLGAVYDSGPEAPPVPRKERPKGLVAAYEDREGQELPVGSKCGKQAASWHDIHHYKGRLLLSIHALLRLRPVEELKDPKAAAARLQEVRQCPSEERGVDNLSESKDMHAGIKLQFCSHACIRSVLLHIALFNCVGLV